jgi:cupin fold WbuC family metalloprotein
MKKLIDKQLIFDTIQKAKLSRRKRINFNFHELHETYQRFLNVLCKGTYIRPHRHSNPPKAETFLVLQGKIAFLIFNEQAEIIEKHILSNQGPNFGIDLQPNVWHSLVCLSEVAVCFEGKHGPYEPSTDKEFAKWAPEENTQEANILLQEWEKLFIPL